jgi:hypothetical protein
MALFIANYSTSRTKETLIAGVAGKIILVTRIALGAGGDGMFKLLSDPNGAAEEDITPYWRVQASDTVNLVLGRRYGVAAGRGKALALTSTIGAPSQQHGIMIWYEMVD